MVLRLIKVSLVRYLSFLVTSSSKYVCYFCSSVAYFGVLPSLNEFFFELSFNQITDAFLSLHRSVLA